MIWNRECDRILAEKCEGLKFIERGMAGGPDLPEPPHYNTDIAACIRAAEAWVFGGPKGSIRHWKLQRVGKHEIWAICEWLDEATQLWIEKRTFRPTAEAALAEALYEAVTQ